jgi:hypothetical protein
MRSAFGLYRRLTTLVVTVSCFAAFVSTSSADTVTPDTTPVSEASVAAADAKVKQPNPIAGRVTETKKGGGLSADVLVPLVLSGTIVLFGLIVLGLQTLIIIRSGSGWTETATKTFGLTIVITAGVYLCTAGFTTDQITPMITLLGTVAGFLFGRNSQPVTEGAAPAKDQLTSQDTNQAQS